jgi:hypothetical protein
MSAFDKKTPIRILSHDKISRSPFGRRHPLADGKPRPLGWWRAGAVRKEFFKEPYPASIVFVAALLNPDWLVEVEAIAVVD